MKPLKDNHKQALRWLHEHGGSAVRVNRRGASGRLSGGRQAVLSQCDFAPFTWATFKRLIEHGHIRERAGFRIQVVVQS